MRYAVKASLLSGALALIAFPANALAQGLTPSPYTPPLPATSTPTPTPAPRFASPGDPRVQAATAVTAQPRPASPSLPSAPRLAATSVPPVQRAASTYWGPAKPAPPKRKPSALRRFFNRFGGGEDENFDPEQGLKVTRDLATGRTNIIGSKPWQPPSP